MTKRYAVEVSWVEAGTCYIEANSPEEAADKVGDCDLPEDVSYAGGFEIIEVREEKED